ncbi:MAG: SDR family oxidoreductase [Planctomycetota bacterium]|nr:SDR family oxidoreductase [Planctomycetota bacterium]
MTDSRQPLVLLTGSSGYVGGQLLERLLTSGNRVRCLVRRRIPENRQTTKEVEFVQGDVFEPGSLKQALVGVHTAYYFVHAMGSSGDFVQEDRLAARNFADACTEAGVQRIIYLGGLGNPDHRLSRHLRSRQEVGNLLRTSSASVIEFRASIIIGAGSLSFEMIRALVERLPIMICPKWVQVRAQPIAIEDVLEYLLRALELPAAENLVFEIGGPDQLSYGEIMQTYARERGLKRWMIPLPFLTPFLSSLWLGLVTPLYARVGRKLVESMRNPTLVSNNLVDKYFDFRPRTAKKAIERALETEDREFAENCWADEEAAAQPHSWGGSRVGSRIVESMSVEIDADCQTAFQPIQGIGGENGWYFGDRLWKIRGMLDRLLGGVGSRKGRRHATQLKAGESVDSWRVESFEEGRFLRLISEMKLPGRAWLEFEVTRSGQGSRIRQTAIFDPRGLAGMVYWYSLFPVHRLVFRGMLKAISKQVKDDSRRVMGDALSVDGPPKVLPDAEPG